MLNSGVVHTTVVEEKCRGAITGKRLKITECEHKSQHCVCVCHLYGKMSTL